MPDYTYKCNICGKNEEVTHSMNSKVSIFCCDREMIKQIGQASVIFNGSGFYCKDKGK